MNYRDFLQKVIYYLINPLIEGMIKIGITPNFITTTGFILNLFATGLMIYAAIYDPSNTTIIGYAGGVIIFAGLFDMMDGRLARLGNMQSTFGALWDSTLDRYSELFTLFGILFYLLANQWVWSGIITFLAIIGSIMVSYVRARGEGLGLDVKVGFMQRPERVVVTAIGAIVCGACNSLWALAVPMMLIALLANITAFWRIAYCYKQLKGK
ncbi:CDP-alcohol phosphatidyltransferase family protein [Hoylesella nanceiensis]|uniref:CDP-alcohol phosphatidyltransferase family protein n=1 Tax=Hoylesella nanceiensis TaxID=425941 RepID=UPI001CABFEDB|nr:CDP-alcohol phosphatidyltransferase family protein [Hoylesella nanceiensis]MBF1421755.1 CDP-alcohol phosphatidyltransferase family protein [Hoylesella nanceiensis]